jgi:large subunit ribosomal protein L1
MQRSKAYRTATEKVEATRLYSPAEAMALAKDTSTTKFDATVEVAFRLGVDPRRADQMVRGTVNLPHGTGKTARVLVFATGDRAEEARTAGADYVGADELIERVQGGFLDFDAVVATPDLMGKVGRLGRILGPRSLMPNPKTGTVTMDVGKAVTDIKGGKIEFRVDKNSNLHLIIGKTSFSNRALLENYAAALEEGGRHHHDGPGHSGRPRSDSRPHRRADRRACRGLTAAARLARAATRIPRRAIWPARGRPRTLSCSQRPSAVTMPSVVTEGPGASGRPAQVTEPDSGCGRVPSWSRPVRQRAGRSRCCGPGRR